MENKLKILLRPRGVCCECSPAGTNILLVEAKKSIMQNKFANLLKCVFGKPLKYHTKNLAYSEVFCILETSPRERVIKSSGNSHNNVNGETATIIDIRYLYRVHYFEVPGSQTQ